MRLQSRVRGWTSGLGGPSAATERREGDARHVTEGVSAWLIGRPLSFFIAGLCSLLLLIWLPHYLLWPWWADLDAFSVLAHSWDVGVLPYRDISAYNFPGHIYLFWALGKAFGWSATWPIYAFDAGLLVAFGTTLVLWSRAVLDRALPGWVGFFTFLLFYLGLDWTNVAQRDWHCVAFAFSGLLILQASRTWKGAVVAALLFALGLSIRPYAVLFVPAALATVAGRYAKDGKVGATSARASIAWLFAFSAFACLMFVPLLADGLLGDFFRSLEMARTRYDARVLTTGIRNAMGQASFGNLAVWLGMAYAWQRGDRRHRPLILAWGLLTAAAFVYRLIAPFDHPYLRFPIRLAVAVDVALVLGIVLESQEIAASGKLWLTFLLAGAGSMMAGTNLNVTPHQNLGAIRTLLAGGIARKCPAGATTCYPWVDYQATLAYLRDRTGPETRVANLLRERSPALCGPTARLPVFPVDTPSLDWLWLNSFHTEADFVGFLERSENSVVVWAPDESGWHDPNGRRYDALTASVRRLYRPAARFGEIEIWTRVREG